MDIVEDTADTAELLLDDDTNAVITTIKMKLTSFVTHKGLQSLINTAVLNANFALAETYMFSNFHITTLLQDNLALTRSEVLLPVSLRCDDHEHAAKDGASCHA